MIDTYNIIFSIIEDKKSKDKEPAMATHIELKNEVFRAINKELKFLLDKGKIKCHRTINGFSISLK